jgi:hypothetical protein
VKSDKDGIWYAPTKAADWSGQHKNTLRRRRQAVPDHVLPPREPGQYRARLFGHALGREDYFYLKADLKRKKKRTAHWMTDPETKRALADSEVRLVGGTEYYSVRRSARYVGVPIKTFRKWIRDKVVGGKRCGKNGVPWMEGFVPRTRQLKGAFGREMTYCRKSDLDKIRDAAASGSGNARDPYMPIEVGARECGKSVRTLKTYTRRGTRHLPNRRRLDSVPRIQRGFSSTRPWVSKIDIALIKKSANGSANSDRVTWHDIAERFKIRCAGAHRFAKRSGFEPTPEWRTMDDGAKRKVNTWPSEVMASLEAKHHKPGWNLTGQGRAARHTKQPDTIVKGGRNWKDAKSLAETLGVTSVHERILLRQALKEGREDEGLKKGTDWIRPEQPIVVRNGCHSRPFLYEPDKAIRYLASLGFPPPRSTNSEGTSCSNEQSEHQDTRAAARSPNKRKKRSTQRGDGRIKLVAALTKHHRYADNGCLNLEPIGSNELAEQAGVSKATASRFFDALFKGHDKYLVACRDTQLLTTSLKMLNGDFAPFQLYGAIPAGQAAKDDD